ncbi:hypothetical protein ACQP0C_38620 [Nocardia sp. CA-129566]|uniref:hypothetical protein n=1 Tax=Nocardia sp. CA-129566 TaxID=3239976 RepID=UPI003D976239
MSTRSYRRRSKIVGKVFGAHTVISATEGTGGNDLVARQPPMLARIAMALSGRTARQRR